MANKVIRIPIRTDGSGEQLDGAGAVGAFVWSSDGWDILNTVGLQLGTLDDSGTLTITDVRTGLVILDGVTLSAIIAHGGQVAPCPVPLVDKDGAALGAAVGSALICGDVSIAIAGAGASASGMVLLGTES